MLEKVVCGLFRVESMKEWRRGVKCEGEAWGEVERLTHGESKETFVDIGKWGAVMIYAGKIQATKQWLNQVTNSYIKNNHLERETKLLKC